MNYHIVSVSKKAVTSHNTILSSIPILGEILTAIDFIILVKLANDGITLDNASLFFMRFISIGASLMAVSQIIEWRLPSIEKENSLEINLLAFTLIVVFNFFFMWIFQEIYINTIFELLSKIREQLNQIGNFK
jgi:hypothetical protein